MRSYRAVLVIAGAGLLTFGLVFSFLQLSGSRAESEPIAVATTTTPEPVRLASDSLAPTLTAGQIAVGVTSADSEPPLLSVQPGDRLDVLASLPAPADSRPVTVVVVSGATVLRPASTSDPLLLEVSGPDAIVLAHLILGGTHLTYTIWPDGGNPPPRQQPLDEQTARALLGLPALPGKAATPEPSLIPPAPLAPTATPRPESYLVQDGESLYSVATRLNVNPGALWWANRALIDPTVPLVAGTRLQVPVTAGFLYQVQPGDTWDSVSQIFGVPASELWQRNELPESAELVSGMLLLIPGQT